MNPDKFRASLKLDEAPLGMGAPLTALWWDAKGDWAKAHECAQQSESPDHAWVHAYLHRKEGDIDNARYWYGRAGRSVFSGSLEEEWKEIAKELLDR